MVPKSTALIEPNMFFFLVGLPTWHGSKKIILICQLPLGNRSDRNLVSNGIKTAIKKTISNFKHCFPKRNLMCSCQKRHPMQMQRFDVFLIYLKHVPDQFIEHSGTQKRTILLFVTCSHKAFCGMKKPINNLVLQGGFLVVQVMLGGFVTSLLQRVANCDDSDFSVLQAGFRNQLTQTLVPLTEDHSRCICLFWKAIKEDASVQQAGLGPKIDVFSPSKALLFCEVLSEPVYIRAVEVGKS